LSAGRAQTKDMATGERSISVDGNRLTFLPEGAQRWAALIALIDGAKTSLRLLYYIYTADRSGAAVRSALLRAMDRGVSVALLIDGFGSSDTHANYFRELHERGARFCRFNPSFGRSYLLRNHQKLALADGETDQPRILIGGFNIEDSYFGDFADKAWRDIGLLVEGPAAARVVAYYDALMSWALNRRSRMKTLRAVVRRFSEHEGPLQWQYGGPMQLKSPWALATIHDLARANDLEMIAAYFAPMGGMLKRIGQVARRGLVHVSPRAAAASRCASTAARWAAVSVGGRPDRGRSASPAKPWARNRVTTRRTVCSCRPIRSAIHGTVWSWLDRRTISRRSRSAGAVPAAHQRRCHSACCSAVSRMRYPVAIGAPPCAGHSTLVFHRSA